MSDFGGSEARHEVLGLEFGPGAGSGEPSDGLRRRPDLPGLSNSNIYMNQVWKPPFLEILASVPGLAAVMFLSSTLSSYRFA